MSSFVGRSPVCAGALSVVFASFLLAGCGGGSHSGSTAPATTTTTQAAPGGAVSQAVFDKHGNRICSGFERRLGALGQPKTQAAIVRVVRAGLAARQAELRQLMRLTPPSEDREGLTAYVRLLRKELALAPSLASAAKAGGAHLQTALGRLTRLEEQANQAANGIGLRTCGRASSAGK
jgi:hypothetical protein